MNNRLTRHKNQANLLLKHFRSEDKDVSVKAAERLLQLPFLKHSNATTILEDRDFFRLKHAYGVIAIENGSDNWSAFREQIIQEDCMYTSACGAYLNVWLNNYEEAKVHQQTHGGYLLSYRQHFYIGTDEVVATLRLDHLKEEWAAIGYDWVQPQDNDAHKTIYKQAKANYLAKKQAHKKAVNTNRPQWLRG